MADAVNPRIVAEFAALEEELIDLYRTNKIKNCAVGRFEYRPAGRPRWERTLWNDVMYGESLSDDGPAPTVP